MLWIFKVADKSLAIIKAILCWKFVMDGVIQPFVILERYVERPPKTNIHLLVGVPASLHHRELAPKFPCIFHTLTETSE